MENNVLQDLLNRVIGDSFGCVFSKDEYVKMDTGKFYVYNTANWLQYYSMRFCDVVKNINLVLTLHVL